MLVAITLVACSLLVVLLVGYPLWLRSGRRRTPSGDRREPAVWPMVDVVVPIHNEADLIERKLENLRELRYPEDRRAVWIVDGASTDGSAALAAARTQDLPGCGVVRLPVADKTAQLNAILERSNATWVLVTDADAWLPPDTLTRLVAEGEADSQLDVVGTWVEPAEAHPLERLHWRLFNQTRQTESDRGCASIVHGPCYLFRRALLDELPVDVVEDGGYVALLAAAKGARVGCVPIVVVELRAPRSLPELLRQKLRRADGYLRELFRYLPRAGAMPSPAREIFLWRFAQMVVAPVLAGLSLAGGIAILLSAGGEFGLPLLLLGGLAPMVALQTPPRSAHAYLLLPVLGAVLLGVLLVALLRYPFSRQTACYPKVAAPRRTASTGPAS